MQQEMVSGFEQQKLCWAWAFLWKLPVVQKLLELSVSDREDKATHVPVQK